MSPVIFEDFSKISLIIDKFLKGILQVEKTENKKVPLKNSINYFLSMISEINVVKKLMIAVAIEMDVFDANSFEIILFKFKEGFYLN